jgi:hypothetical protein
VATGETTWYFLGGGGCCDGGEGDLIGFVGAVNLLLLGTMWRRWAGESHESLVVVFGFECVEGIEYNLWIDFKRF